MYSYYAFRALKYRIPKWIQISVTVCQILQMAVGCFVNYKAYTYKQNDAVCDVTYSNIGWSFAMYSVYFGLFLHFFYIAYFPKKKRVETNDENGINQTKERLNNDHFFNQMIPLGILIILVLHNIAYPSLSSSKYISWCIGGLLLFMYVRLRTVSSLKLSFPLKKFCIKKSQ